MPVQRVEYSGYFELPEPNQQYSSVQTKDFDTMAIFEYPAGDLANPHEEVRRQWGLREARLSCVLRQIIIGDNLRILPEDILTAAACLKWMKGLEEWLRKSFLHVIFSDSGGKTRWVTFDGPRDREDLVYEFGHLWDHIFHVMRQFLIEIHYTNDIDLTGDTLRPHTEHEVYVDRKKLLIAPLGPEDCSATTPLDEYKLAWWEHRKIILQRSTGRREGVAWLLQDREEMDELARRYPDAKATLRRPFMMPAIQVR